MLHEIARIFREVKSDSEVDVITMVGAGTGFCVGIDFDEDSIPEHAEQNIMAYKAREIWKNILDAEKPIITGVNGPAIGFGAALALMSDIVIASKKARIGDANINLGLTADDGLCLIFPLLAGVNKAKEILLTGDIVDAREGLRIGLFNRVVPSEQLDQTVRETALKLASGHQQAIRYTKSAVNRYLKCMLSQVDDIALNTENIYKGCLNNSIMPEQEASRHDFPVSD
jgi:enoyl-CoA hydratase